MSFRPVRFLALTTVVAGLLLGPSVEALAAGSNLVTNPNFADGTTGWNVGPGDTLTVVSGGHDTLNAGEVSNAKPKPRLCLLSDDPDTVPSASAGTYTASIWLDGPAGSVIFSMKEHGPSHNLVGEAKKHLTLTGTTWQRVSVSYTVITAGDSLGITVVKGKAPSGECFLADNADVQYAPSS